jgi:hypothetical protein
MYVKSFKMSFIDSYKLIPIGLRKFPKTFALNELSKGYFPYRFLSPERVNYEGPMPSLDWFDFDSLKDKERDEAVKWYEDH